MVRVTKIQTNNGEIVQVITGPEGSRVVRSDGTVGPQSPGNRHDDYVADVVGRENGKIVDNKGEIRDGEVIAEGTRSDSSASSKDRPDSKNTKPERTQPDPKPGKDGGEGAGAGPPSDKPGVADRPKSA
jgi:hypothetical protein